ncbi:MAG: tetratricopeptide repeat protein [Parcubacteria group bacterium]|nr:tetratricopeptide repeat protein [Parcubacteria group bacterium]
MEILKNFVADISGERSKQDAGTSIDALIAWVIVAGFFLTPLLFVPFESIPLEWGKMLFIAAIALATLVLWVVARLKEGAISIPKSPILLAAFAIVVVFILAALFSPVMSVSLGGVAYEFGTALSFAFLFVLLVLVSALFRNAYWVSLSYFALFLSFLVAFVYHALRLVVGVDFLDFGIFTSESMSLLGKWNDFGIFAGLVALLTLMIIELSYPQGRMRIFAYTLLGAALIVLATINFSVSWILLGGTALVMVVYHLSVTRFVETQRKKVYAFPVTALVVLLIASVFLMAGSAIGNAIRQYVPLPSVVEVRPSWSATVDIIKQTWKEQPLVGNGPNRFNISWLLHKPDAINATQLWNTDFRHGVGLIPTYAVTAGLLGLLAWLVFFGTFLYSAARSLFAFSDTRTNYLVLSSFVAALYLWLTAIFYTPGVTIVAFAFFFTGIFIALLAQKKEIPSIEFSYIRDPRTGFFSVLALVALLVVTAGGMYDFGKRGLSLLSYHQGSVAAAEGNLDKADAALVRAGALQDSDVVYRSLSEIRIGRLSTLLGRQDLSPDNARAEFQNILGSTIDAAQNAVRYDTTNYRNWLTLSRVYTAVVPLNVTGAYENAKAGLEQSRLYNPKSPELFLEEARLEAGRGDNDKARELIQQSLVLKNNYTDAIFLLAQMQIDEGNVKDAIRSVEQASIIDANNPGVFFRLGLLRYANKDYRGAASAFERAVTLLPDYANAQYYLGLSLDMIGESERAIAIFDGLTKTNPDNEDIKNILENLKDGRAPFAERKTASPAELDEPPIEE